MTLNGKIEYSRNILRPSDQISQEKLLSEEGLKSVAPLDSYLGIFNLPFKMTPGMMLRVAYFAQNQCSYQKAEEILKNVYGIYINDDTIRLVTNYIGGMIFEEDCRKAEECNALLQKGKLSFRHNKSGVLYIETDGAALNTRYQNEDGSTWRENKLGIVFSSKDIYLGIDKKEKRQHQIRRREYISYIGSSAEFGKHLLACALRNGYGEFKETVLLSDGATWIRNMGTELFPDAQHILDFFHLSENVYTYAKTLFNSDESKYKPWAEDICKSLKESNANQVLAELKKYKDKELRQCAVNLHGYITNNLSNIDYKEYCEKGYFIGSGAIESGNKVVLQKRLKQAGMRWNTQTAQCILSLKAKEESGLWEKDVMQYIQKQLIK